MLFLGNDENGNPVGIHTERHAITIAGSQSGKGVGVITPNLLRWPHNALVIDPKGEAAKRTIKAREKMGIPSFVFDPFFDADVPPHLRVFINPMDRLDLDALTIKEDINAIADGLVSRHVGADPHWDDGGVRVLAGLIGWVKLRYVKEEQNLLTVRAILRDDDLLEETLEDMKHETRCGAVCQTATATARAKEGRYFLSNAQGNTEWLDSDAMQKALAHTTFDLSRLKWERASLFLVLPAEYIAEHGRFLRLFVRVAINAMQKKRNGQEKGELCLFMLDEFFALGKINEVAVSAGLMAGYGLKLWPICQNLTQLYDLYGRDSAATFFGSADLQQFFGGMDDESLAYVSNKIGNYGVDDIPPEPTTDHQRINAIAAEIEAEKARLFSDKAKIDQLEVDLRAAWFLAEESQKENLQRFRNTISQVIGKPRVPTETVARIVQKPERGPSEHMLAVTHGGKVLKVKLAPYYLEQPSAPGRNEMKTKSAAKPAPPAKKPAPAPMASPAIKSPPNHRWVKGELRKSLPDWLPPKGSKAGALQRLQTLRALHRIHKLNMQDDARIQRSLSLIGGFLAQCERGYPAKGASAKVLKALA